MKKSMIQNNPLNNTVQNFISAPNIMMGTTNTGGLASMEGLKLSYQYSMQQKSYEEELEEREKKIR
jgi:hypothetical protein